LFYRFFTSLKIIILGTKRVIPIAFKTASLIKCRVLTVISYSSKFNRYFSSPNNVSHCLTDLGVALVNDNGDVDDGILSEGIEKVVVSVKKKKFSFINTDI
jgi:hypothetical protein